MKAKKSAASSQPAPLTRWSEKDRDHYLKSSQYQRDVEVARAFHEANGGEPWPQELEDIPQLTREELAAIRPAKQQLTIRLDTDVLRWLKTKPGPYQSRLNHILRTVMVREAEQRNTQIGPKQTKPPARRKAGGRNRSRDAIKLA